MKQLSQLVYMTCVLALLALPVHAQQWSPEQQEIWQLIDKQWELEQAEDNAWKAMLHDSFQSWSTDDLMPFDKADTTRFADAEAGHFKILVQHTAPVGIIVTGDTAVVHYYHTTIVEHDDGEKETIDGRFTDILTRTGDAWLFVSWVGEEEGED
jgi:ketosteroid isomerase-like protein